MKTQTQLIRIATALGLGIVFLAACEESGGPIPACDGSTASRLVSNTITGPCSLSTAAADCSATSIPPNTVGFCTHRIANPADNSLRITETASPASSIILPVGIDFAGGTAGDFAITADCTNPDTASGTYTVRVTNSAGNVICEDSVAYDLTVTP